MKGGGLRERNCRLKIHLHSLIVRIARSIILEREVVKALAVYHPSDPRRAEALDNKLAVHTLTHTAIDEAAVLALRAFVACVGIVTREAECRKKSLALGKQLLVFASDTRDLLLDVVSAAAGSRKDLHAGLGKRLVDHGNLGAKSVDLLAAKLCLADGTVPLFFKALAHESVIFYVVCHRLYLSPFGP